MAAMRIALTARLGLVLATLAALGGGCAFRSNSSADADDSIIDGDQPGSWSDNATAGFAEGTRTAALLDDGGRVASDGFAYGGLHATSYDSLLLATETDSWAAVQTAIGNTLPRGQRVDLAFEEDWSLGHPLGLNLRGNNDEFSVVYDGEIELSAGTHPLFLDADDMGFVEIDLGNGFAPVIDAKFDRNGNTSMQVPRSGWYPIRAVVSENIIDSKFIFRIDGAVVPPTKLRSSVGALRGWHVQGFSQYLPTDRFATTLDLGALDEDWQFGTPDADIVNANDPNRFMVRYSAQIKIEVAGDYQFDLIVNDNGSARRVWLDGDLVGGQWGDAPAIAPRSLDTGWHDIVVDYAEWSLGSAGIELRLVAAPTDVALGIVPVAMVRPVLRHGRLVADYGNPGSVVIADGGSGFVSMNLAAPANAKIVSLYTEYFNQHPRPADLTCDVIRPDDTREALGRPRRGSNRTEFNSNLKGSAGLLVNPNGATTWKLQCADDVANIPGAFRQGFLAIEYIGGANPPFAPEFSFQSAPRNVAGLIGVTNVEVKPHAALPPGATVVIECRFAADIAGLAQATWQPLAPGMALRNVGPAMQYRVTITSDGWDQIELDEIKVNYRFK